MLSIALAGGLLVALAIPALGMNVVQSGTDELPKDIAVIQTYDRYKAAFPSEANAVVVAVEADDVSGGATGAAIDELMASSDESPRDARGRRGRLLRGRNGRQRRPARRRGPAPTRRR